LPATLVVAGMLGLPSSGVVESSSAAGDPVIVAAGDIACDPDSSSFNGGNGESSRCRQRFTAPLLRGATAVLPLGDLQYENGDYAKYLKSYAPSWGAYKPITHPVPGNHDYKTSGAKGYFDYFGSIAAERGKGYYSFDLGAWHLVALNSEIDTHAGSAQERWLRADLAAMKKSCILAYWHKPRFSSGEHGNDGDLDAFWRALYAAHADVVLTGHDHDYERFGLQNPDARADPKGIRAFVVGTGGRSLRDFSSPEPNSEVRNSSAFGVLRMTLHPGSYEWKFVPEKGSFTDSGKTACHRGSTSLVLSSFTSKRTLKGVLVRWRTSGGTSIRGYNLYRERAGRRVRLNGGLIRASGSGYSWLDRSASKGALRYRLQTVDMQGRKKWLGVAAVKA
jgi:calcineurin-like phosphoesterase family protein